MISEDLHRHEKSDDPMRAQFVVIARLTAAAIALIRARSGG